MATGHDTLAIDRLSAEDVRILGLETTRVAGHTLKVTVVHPDAPSLGIAELRSRVAARIEALPRLTERLDRAPDGGFAWVPDPTFHLDRHVREREDRDGLAAAVAATMQEHLDRDLPLWTIELVGGRAVVLKAHHAMADGMAARRIARVLLWDLRETPAAHAHAAGPEPAGGHGLADVPRLSACRGGTSPVPRRRPCRLARLRAPQRRRGPGFRPSRPSLLDVGTVLARVPVRLRWQLRRPGTGQHARRPELRGDVHEVDEHLQMPEPRVIAGNHQRVVQVVPVQRLVVVGGAGVLRPRFGRVDPQVPVLEQDLREVYEAVADREQAQLRAREREAVDPRPLVHGEPVSPPVGAVMESRCGGIHGRQFAERGLQLRGGDEPGENHESVRLPLLRGAVEVHHGSLTPASPPPQPVLRDTWHAPQSAPGASLARR